MPYYIYIDSQRYDGSLINNARRFARTGQRISREEAQQLWLMALDGGRITSIEKQTFEYLFEAFQWTDAALEWIRAEMQKESTTATSYYRIIDGLRYDRKILDKAEELTTGSGDGRISLADARFILPAIADAGDVRIEEERALNYILDNYTWSEAAREWLQAQVNPLSHESNFTAQVNAILRYEFDLERLALELPGGGIQQQSLVYANQIEFPEALRRALDNLFQYDSQDSLRRIVANVFEFFPGRDNWESLLEGRIRELLNDTRIILLDEAFTDGSDDADYDAPPNGEAYTQNWILCLPVENLSDHIFWIVVPRDGEGPVYNYGVN